MSLEGNAVMSPDAALTNRIIESNLRYNWDGYGAVTPPETVIESALNFCNCILDEGFINAVRKDGIVPTPYGGIVFDFNTDKGAVSVEVGCGQMGFFTEFANGNDFASGWY